MTIASSQQVVSGKREREHFTLGVTTLNRISARGARSEGGIATTI